MNEDRWYMGISPAEKNLSTWLGGMLHYKKEEADISRAKFKLMEAMEVFRLELGQVQTALDLGAVPGGWTSVLLEQGLAVTAVDTGDMDPRLNRFKGYTYIKGNVSELELPKNSFDMLTSDISWNPKNTAQLVNRAADFLKDGGLAVVTVKLMGTKLRRMIKEVKEIYQEKFDIREAKQLFHNRDEITLVMGKRKA
jgi:23S rRNA (cytidine2498-2'-O)-methyltransferase